MITGTFYTIGEAAIQLKKHQNTVSNWVKQGQLPVIRMGNIALIREEDLKLVDGLLRPAKDR